MSRPIAVRTIKAIEAMRARLLALESDWSDTDEYLRSMLAERAESLRELQLEIEESWPGRRREVTP